MKAQIFIIVLALTVVLTSCGKNDGVAPINPNGDSELALLMRDMFDEAMRMKGQIEKGKIPKIVKQFKEMHTAEATEPDKVAMPIYKTFTDAYHESLTALEQASSQNAHQAFNGVVQSCMNCHQAMCPGPIVKIEKLWVEGVGR